MANQEVIDVGSGGRQYMYWDIFAYPGNSYSNMFLGIWNCKVFQNYHAIKSHCICFCWFCNNFWFSKFWHTRYYLFFLRGKLYLDKDCVYKYCWWKGYVEIHLNHVIWGNLIHIMHNILGKSNQIRIVKLLLYTTPWVYKI